MMLHSVGCPFGHLGPAVLAMSPSNFLCMPRIFAGGVGWEAQKPWYCVSPAQPQVGHRCFINVVLFTNSKHSTIQAAMKKIKSILAKSRHSLSFLLTLAHSSHDTWLITPQMHCGPPPFSSKLQPLHSCQMQQILLFNPVSTLIGFNFAK